MPAPRQAPRRLCRASVSRFPASCVRPTGAGGSATSGTTGTSSGSGTGSAGGAAASSGSGTSGTTTTSSTTMTAGGAAARASGSAGTGVTATYASSSQWNNGFVASYTITNTGTTPLTNWQLQFNLPANDRHELVERAGCAVGHAIHRDAGEL